MRWPRGGQLALTPGTYRVRAAQYGGVEAETEVEVSARAPAEPFVLDLR